MTRRFRISGTVEEKETGRPLPELIVRAYDKDLLADDLLGFTTTDADGRFEIFYTEDAFKDVVESQPDVYLRIYDRMGRRLLHETRDAVRRNASADERYRVVIPAAKLSERNSEGA
jgi:hypothetical protein